MEGRPHDIFVSFPSVKSGESPHTAEIISFCDADSFRQWADLPKGDRGPDYSALKERVARGMLDLAESAAPGLSDLVDYLEVSTPLTYAHYTAHPAGAFYGPPATPLRYRSDPLGPRTAIPRLFLSGQDAGSTGIMGAMMGGLAAAPHPRIHKVPAHYRRASTTPSWSPSAVLPRVSGT